MEKWRKIGWSRLNVSKTLPKTKSEFAPWKSMVGRWTFLLGLRRTVRFREGKNASALPVTPNYPGVWVKLQIFFMFTPENGGRWTHFEEHIFSTGLKPPTTGSILGCFFGPGKFGILFCSLDDDKIDRGQQWNHHRRWYWVIDVGGLGRMRWWFAARTDGMEGNGTFFPENNALRVN